MISNKVKKRMIVFDTAWTHKHMQEHNLTAILTGRDLGGYFNHIWSIHGVASIIEPEGSSTKFGKPIKYNINQKHTLIEGKIGRFKFLKRLPILNFIFSQIDILLVALKLIKKNKINLIRAEDIHYNGLLAYIISKITKIPFVVGVWGNPDVQRRFNKKPMLPKLFKYIWIEELVEVFILKRATKVMIQNDENRQFVLSKGIKKSKTEITRLGNLLNPIHFEEPEKRKGGKKILEDLGLINQINVLVISRLEEKKLCHHPLYAVRELLKKDIKVNIIYSGDGPFKSEIEKMIDYFGMQKQIFLCGNKNQEWIANLLPEVNAFLAPLAGRALAEASLGAVPIIAYDRDWHSELVVTGETGELVPNEDYKEMALALERILLNKEKARLMGKKIRIKALNLLDPKLGDKLQKEMFEEIYADL